MRQLHWGKIVVGALVAEVLAVATLVAVVLVYELVSWAQAGVPLEGPAIQAWAEQAGRVVGPLGGAVWTFLASALVARRARERPVAHGLAIGVLLAVFDVVFLVGMQGSFELLYVGSNALRMAAGAAGGHAGR
jgi:hypothetical protein